MSEDRTDRKDRTGASTLVDKPADADGDGDLVSGATKREGQGSERSNRKLSGSPQPADEKLSRGTLVGRYVVVDVLGEGGMGVVYTAYDPELDRKVAIKLLQGKPSGGGSTSHGDQAWLQREAQALARLAHPNVIAVHDVGTLPGDRVYVAMELVEGMTLRAWLKQPRTWRDVRDLMLAAGAGLAAAHRSGLIHRDFKPENVLVGNDGRVRVMDFGLARLQPSDEAPAARTSDLQIEARSPLSESLTIAGSVVGTPAYMAPEIFEGVSASAHSDQFAFGVTLYELLFLARPYEKRAFAPTPDRPPLSDIKPRDPPKVGVPQRLQRVAMRAISIDPDARFASMDALLAELAIDPMATRRYAALGIGGAAVVMAAVIATMKLTGSGGPGPDRRLLCKGAERHLAGVWDPAIKKTIRGAFDKSEKPFKATAYAAIESTLDKYTLEWTTAVTESCEATKLTGVQTEDVQSLRQDCFDQRLAVVRSFTGLLANADDQLIEKASNAALALEREESVRRCADVAALKAPTQPTAEIRPRVLTAQSKLADARAGIFAGNYGRAINASREAVTLATAIPFDPLIAETHLVLGMAMMLLGDGPAALTSLSEGTWAGLRGRRDDIAGEAALFAAGVAMQHFNKPDQAKIFLEVAKASIVRAGRPARTEINLLATEGIIANHTGDIAGGVAAHTRAVARAIEVYGKDNPQVAQSHQLLGASLAASGDYAAALPHYERARELTIKLLGEEHPDLAVMYSNLGSAYHYAGDLEASRRSFARALEMRERVFGANSPVLIPTLNNTAELLRHTDLPAALAMNIRAKRLAERLGKGHPYFPSVTSSHGEILLDMGRLAEARVALDDALAAAERSSSPYLGTVLTERARLARAQHDWPRSVALDTRAIATLEKSAGKDAVLLWKPLAGLALAKLRDKKYGEARELLDRALAIVTKGKVNERQLGELRRAQALLPPT